MEDGNRAYSEGGRIEVVLETVVRCTEIDVNGHVNNAKFVEYLEWGREEWYDSHGFAYDRLRGLGAITVVVNINLNLRRACRQGDRLRIITRPDAGVARASPSLSGSNRWTVPWRPTRPSPSSPSIRTPVEVGPCPRSSAASFQLPPESTGRPVRISAQPASRVASRRRPGRRLAAVLSRRAALWPNKNSTPHFAAPNGKALFADAFNCQFRAS